MTETNPIGPNAAGDGQHVVKLESDVGKVEFLPAASELEQSTVFAKSPIVTQLQTNNIKRIIQTASGQLIIIPSNGGQAILPASVFTQAKTITTSRPLISTPTPIPVAKVTNSNPLLTRTVSSSHSGSLTTDVTNASDRVSPSVNSVAQVNNEDAHLLPSSEHTNFVLYNDGSGDNEHVTSGEGRIDSTSEIVVDSAQSSAAKRVTYIQTVDALGNKVLQVAPHILQSSPAKQQIVIAPNQLAVQTSLVSQAQLIAESMVGLAQSSNISQISNSQITNIQQLGEGSQLFLPKGDIKQDTSVELVPTSNEGQQLSFQDVQHPCPVCGDKISGYHYGIFTCESCKGFFKRTVQNKKAFICHRKGDCDINILARKKCPACRFKRCLLAGMKLEAVREDRQRGGRSSYDGAQNYARSPRQAPSTGSHPSTPRTVVVKRVTPKHKAILLPVENGNHAIVYQEDNKPAAAATAAAAAVHVPLQPHTPSVLEDMKAVESVMNEDELEQDCCRGKFQEGDDNLFVSLLHFADHCLYKIVRWARNMPDFGTISTDDQILLLQNCWGELLCLCCCWNSIRCSENEVRIAAGRHLTMEIATLLGIEDLTQRLLDFVGHLRQLQLDSHEFIALKTMLLLNPDVKNLRDSAQIRDHQERVSAAMLIHSASHYQENGNKFCQLVSRLPELSRLSVQGKEILRARQSQGELPQYSLLSELLKGDVVVQ